LAEKKPHIWVTRDPFRGQKVKGQVKTDSASKREMQQVAPCGE